MRTNAWLAIGVFALFLIWPVSTAPAGKQVISPGQHLYLTPAAQRTADDLAVTDYQFVSATRAGLVHYDYTYTITVTNSAEALDNVVAQATSTSKNTEILSGTVMIGDMDADSSVQSTDTLVFRHNRQYLFDPNSIVWTFRADPATPDNTPPVADAGPDQSVSAASVVTLNGSGSTDADGDALTYLWGFVSTPAGSTTMLDDVTAVMPMFTADVPGDYVVQLVVNDGEDDSVPNTVTISTFNTPPVADAGLDQTVLVGATVFLSGIASSDANDDPLTYAWSLIKAPPGSAATLSSTNLVETSFIVDVAGSYALQLIVNDGYDNSLPDTVMITTENSAPVADAGSDQTVNTGDTVTLDGSLSFDVDDDPLTYSWTLTTQPAGSSAAITNPTAAVAQFIADIDGAYVAQLIVNDGTVDSSPDTALITVNAVNLAPIAVATADSTSVTPGTAIQLDGTGSSDPEDDPLTYGWSLSVPPGSSATLSSTSSDSPGFVTDIAGTYVATLIVNDGDLDSAPASVTILAADSNSPPRLSRIGNRVMFLRSTLTMRLFASDPDAGDVLTFSLPTQPAGMTLNPVTGDVSFTPNASQLGINNVTARVDDQDSLFDTQSFTIEVRPTPVAPPVNSPPTLDPIANQVLTVGDSLLITTNANDPDAGDTLVYDLPAAPAGMSISIFGEIAWTPGAANIGRHSVTVTVTDNAGAMAYQSFVVTVVSVNRPPVAVDEVYQARISETTTEPAPGVLDNDSDPDNDPITAALVTDVTKGVLDLRADGSFDYTPGLPDETGPVELELQCEFEAVSFGFSPGQTNGTVTVGDIDNDGVNEIVGAYYNLSGLTEDMWVLNAEDCSIELENSPDVLAAGGFATGSHLGLLDIDGDGDLEIIGPRTRVPGSGDSDGRHLLAVHHDGTIAWPGDGGSEDLTLIDPPFLGGPIGPWRFAGPTFADLDGDGTVEIIMAVDVPDPLGRIPGLAVFNSVDGSLLWEFQAPPDSPSEPNPLKDGAIAFKQPNAIVVDLDLDGTMEIIYHSSVIDHNGNREFVLPSELTVGATIVAHLFSAVANFDGDQFPEIVARDKKFHYLFEHDGTLIWQKAQTNTSESQITVADFDNDGVPEFAYNTRFGTSSTLPGYMVVWDTDGETVLWSHETEPTLQLPSTSRLRGPNATAFDANEDGFSDLVIHYDLGIVPESGVYFFDGRDGSILEFVDIYAAGNTGDRQRFVTIVDVDDDGEAEVISSFNGGAGNTRIWQGTAENPLPPAPAMRDQWHFNAAHLDDRRQEIISDPIPHWLQPRLNGHNIISTPDRVYSQLKCEVIAGSFDRYDNATLAVGDVDNDGDIEIVGSSFISTSLNNELWLLNADDCTPQIVPNYQLTLDAGGFTQGSHLGLLDIDGDSDLEIIGIRNVLPGVGVDGDHLLAIHHDGSLVTEWSGDGGEPGVSETIALDNMIGNSSAGGFSQMGPTFADLDANGTIEIIMPWYTFGAGAGTITDGMTVFNSADGSIAWEFTGDLQFGDSDYKPPLIADIDLDGTMEIIYKTYVLDHTGEREFLLPVDPSGPWPTHIATAVANFDDDPYAEIIAIDQHNHYLFNHDGSVIFQIPRSNNSGSQIAVADFDGDHEVEYAWYRGLGSTLTLGYFEVYDTDGSILWSHQGLRQYGEELTRFKGVNPTAFDANHDGAFDLVVHLDVFDGNFENDGVYIFDGRDGSELEFMPIRSAAAEQRFVTIADVDNDGEAEIVSSFTTGLTFATRIWEGATSHPLPAAPAYRNQWIFQEAYVNDDLSFPSNPIPHWLQPGLNGYNLIKLPPDPLAGTTDSFTYLANDGAFNSNIATVTFDVQPPGNAPVFLSQPDTLTTVGFPYSYAPFVVDVDPGDSISFTLAAAPPGMTMDLSGRLAWTPDTVGSYPVSIIASDTIGFSTIQAFTLIVGEPVIVPDVVNLAQPVAEATLTTNNLLLGSLNFSTHPTIIFGSVISQSPIAGSVTEFGGEVDIIVSQGPAPEDIDNDTDGFTENEGDCDDGNDAVFPGAADAAGDGIDSDCDGIDGNLILSEILVSPVSSTVLTGQSIALTATGIFEDGTSQNLTGIVTWTNGPIFSSATAGSFAASATRDGITGNATMDVFAENAGDLAPPIANISAPDTNTTVTGRTDIIGTATDANFLRYELAYAIAGDTRFTPLVISTAPISGGVLGQFDATLLLNDLYTVRLSVFDTGGNVQVDKIMLQVDGQQKIGNYTLTFTDLQVPMAGLPIAITRTYDSRDKSRGDFGVGWNLNLRSIRLRTNRVLGTGWRVDDAGLAFALAPNDAHKVSVVMPGGRVEEFDLVISPAVSPIVPFPPGAIRATYQARAGSLGTLVALDNNFLSILDPQPGEVVLRDDLTSDAYDPQRFRYTAVNGVQFVIDRQDGLESITDANGNVITFSDSGITHSGGKSVVFVRDDLNRITQITDPNGNQLGYTYDANGDLTRYTDAETNVSRYLYNNMHGLIEARDPLGNRAVRNEYDDDGRLSAMIDANGNRVEFIHNIAGNEEVQIDQLGFITRYIYDDNGNVLSKEKTITVEGLPVVALELFEYDSRDLQTAHVDADGVRTETTYDANENVIQTVIDPGGANVMSSTLYDDDALLVSTTDTAGETSSYTYDSNRNLTSVTDSLGNTRQLYYDAAGRLAGLEDAAGTVTASQFDGFGQQILRTVTDAEGNLVAQTGFVYDNNGKRTGRTEYRYVDGVLTPFTTSFTLDALGRRTVIADPQGNESEVEYDAAGQVVARIDANGNRTEFTYDLLGRQIRIDYADSTFVQTDYDGVGNLVQATDALGRITTFTYDELQRRLTTTRPDLTVLEDVYAPGGRQAAAIDARGNRTEFVYDTAGRQTQSILPAVIDGRDNSVVNPTVITAYDAAGRQVSHTDANGNTTLTDYDALGRPTQTTFADGSITLQTYDEIGRVTSRTDQLGRTTSYTYDGAGKLLTITEPSPDGIAPQPVTTYTYDLGGRQLSQSDALGQTTLFTYDAAGRRITKILPGGQAIAISYDAAGNIETQTDPNGDTTTFVYDNRNRISTRTYASGNFATFTYNLNGTLTTAADASGTLSFDYDNMDRVTTITNPGGSQLTYDFDDNGNLAEVASGAQSVIYTYDDINRLTSADDNAGVTSYLYDPNGSQVSIVRPNGASTKHIIDNLNRIASVIHRDSSDNVLEQFDYTFIANGLRSTITEFDGSVESYLYDNHNRLVSEVRTGSTPRALSYAYDLVGNRTSINDNGSIRNYAYDVNGQLLSDGTTTFTYDANGSRTSRNDGTPVIYTWDDQVRLTQVNTSVNTITYGYDVNGSRISRTNAGGTVNYVVDRQSITGLPQVAEERDTADALIAAYSFGNDLLNRNDGIADHYHTDAHGSTQLLTGTLGTEIAGYDYDGYGNLTDSTGSTDNEYLYAGERYDAEADLHYLRARFYDSRTGTFLSRDPFAGDLGVPISLQPYLYAANNPTNLIDPTGRFTIPELSISQLIDLSLQSLSVGARACTLLSQAQTVVSVIELLQLGYSLSGTPTNLGTKAFYEAKLPKKFRPLKALTFELTKDSFKLAFGFEDEDDDDISLELAIKDNSVVGVKGALSGSVDEKLASITYCGKEIGALNALVELELAAGAGGSDGPAAESYSGYTTAEGFTFGLSGQLKAAFELKFAGVAVEAPLFVVKLGGSKSGIILLGIPLSDIF